LTLHRHSAKITLIRPRDGYKSGHSDFQDFLCPWRRCEYLRMPGSDDFKPRKSATRSGAFSRSHDDGRKVLEDARRGERERISALSGQVSHSRAERCKSHERRNPKKHPPVPP
jgi:hypothetical protein